MVPNRWAAGLKFTPEALANDNLDALRSAIVELGLACLDAEKVSLVDLLEGAANGRNAADGTALFVAGHNNSTGTAAQLTQLGNAVRLMRLQTTIGGRFTDLQPAVLLVPPVLEMAWRQTISSTVVPSAAANVNAMFENLTISVEPRLNGANSYLIAGGTRAPLTLGRLFPGPQLSEKVDFNSGSTRFKAEHAYGVCVSEYRSIVRIVA